MANVGRFNTFTCPNCKALYQIVKVEAGQETKDREISCQVCGRALAGRDDKFALKYFLLREGIRRKRPGTAKAGKTRPSMGRRR